tara:strand:- start:803 stop:1036 length:234 start_codon:yes stop_codon:yes gene_type:complete
MEIFAYIITIQWPHAEKRLFMAYAQNEAIAQTLAHEKLIELGDLEEDEDLEGAETIIHADEVVGAPCPDEEKIFWVL